MEIRTDFKELLELFNKHKVEYLIDIITRVSGVSWEQAEAGRVPGHYGDTPVFFIGRGDFIANKKATGR
jgi:hypothetical protein